MTIYGAGLYSWFSAYSQSCVGTQSCQKTLIQVDFGYEGIDIYNLVTIGANNMVTTWNGTANDTVGASINTNGAAYSSWSLVGYMQTAQTAPWVEKEIIAQLSEAWPGIYWTNAFPGHRFGCSEERYAILRETVRIAFGMVEDAEEFHDGAFNRFFISPGQSKFRKYDWRNQVCLPHKFSVQRADYIS